MGSEQGLDWDLGEGDPVFVFVFIFVYCPKYLTPNKAMIETWESARQSSRPSFEPVLCSTNKFNWDGIVMNQKVILKISNDVCWF